MYLRTNLTTPLHIFCEFTINLEVISKSKTGPDDIFKVLQAWMGSADTQSLKSTLGSRLFIHNTNFYNTQKNTIILQNNYSGLNS